MLLLLAFHLSRHIRIFPSRSRKWVSFALEKTKHLLSCWCFRYAPCSWQRIVRKFQKIVFNLQSTREKATTDRTFLSLRESFNYILANTCAKVWHHVKQSPEIKRNYTNFKSWKAVSWFTKSSICYVCLKSSLVILSLAVKQAFMIKLILSFLSHKIFKRRRFSFYTLKLTGQ